MDSEAASPRRLKSPTAHAKRYVDEGVVDRMADLELHEAILELAKEATKYPGKRETFLADYALFAFVTGCARARHGGGHDFFWRSSACVVCKRTRGA